jgi:hypothetical protein
MTDLQKLYGLADRAADAAFKLVAEGTGYTTDEAMMDPEKEQAVYGAMTIVAVIVIAKLLPSAGSRKARKEVLTHITNQAKVLYESMDAVNTLRKKAAEANIVTPNQTQPPGETDA